MRPDVTGRAVVLAPGVFATPNGKTANGLVRFTRRFKVVAVVDPTHAGKDAGMVLDGKANGIPIVATFSEARKHKPEWTVVGVATDGGKLPADMRPLIRESIASGIHVACGLHEFLHQDKEFAPLAAQKKVQLVDVRSLAKSERFFTGDIDHCPAPRIAVLGTDSAIGKRTASWRIVDALNAIGVKATMVGTGQTAWLQGAKYGVLLDRIVNDFLTGEIEGAILDAYAAEKPDVLILEGQGALSHPAFPGGYELIAAGRPEAIVVVHAPKRKTLDGFPQYPMPKLEEEIQLLELASKKKVVAVCINHEDMSRAEADKWAKAWTKKTGLPAQDVLWHGADEVATAIAKAVGKRQKKTAPANQEPTGDSRPAKKRPSTAAKSPKTARVLARRSAPARSGAAAFAKGRTSEAKGAKRSR